MWSRNLVGVGKSVGNFLLDAFDGVLGSEAAHRAARRDSFISANLLAGGIGVIAWPLHWIFLPSLSFSAF